ncbi:MAG: hypothetical protein NE334_13960 [Lentisphaeraceae bacterium]|nr:hypothetical protein [Lentisphaeraceae bacterium]
MKPDEELQLKLQRLLQRSNAARSWKAFMLGIIILAALCLAAAIALPNNSLTKNEFFQYSVYGLLGMYFLVLFKIKSLRQSIDVIVQQIESQNSTLNERLFTALELLQKEEPLNTFEKALIKEVLDNDKEVYWEKSLIPTSPEKSRLLFFVSIVLFVILSQNLSVKFPSPNASFAAEEVELSQEKAPFTGLSVEPGNTEVAKGKNLLITGRFDHYIPAQVSLIVENKDQQQVLEMRKSLGDPIFAANLKSLKQSSSYWLEFNYEDKKQISEKYTITVFEYPKLENLEVTLKYPGYLDKEEKIIEDTRLVSAIKGTQAKLKFTFNKAVKKAYLKDKKQTIELTQDPKSPNLFLLDTELVKSGKFELTALDEKDRKNTFPPQITFKVFNNNPPKFKIQFPGKDLSISPIAELEIRAKITDDVEVMNWGLEYDYQDKKTSISLKEDAKTNKSIDLKKQFKFEEMAAIPNELLSWRLWATDKGNDGKERKTYTDIYFIEFRFLEEIAKQGQSGPPQKGQGETLELIKTQKEIIAATWKLIQKVDISDFDEKTIKDILIVQKSQDEVVKAAQMLLMMLPPNLQVFVQDAIVEMKKASNSLKGSADEKEKEFLAQALDSEQKALRFLLQLNSKLKNIKQQKNAQGSSKSKKKDEMKKRLNLEELKKQRYETKKDAQKEQERKQEREILNALKELSQRQMDLNKEIKQLQAALEKEKDEKKKEELERQLKRLQEEQQELVRDAEKLQEKMNQEENRQKMAQEKQKLEKIKKDMQQTAKDLKEKRLQDSINSGKRTERSLNELKEQVTKKTADEFENELRELKNQAQELTKKVSGIKEEAEKTKTDKPSLTSQGNDDELADKLQESTQDMQKLLEKLQETTKSSEESQAAMSRELYNALREAHEKDTKGKLETAEKLMRRGFKNQAQKDTETAEKELQKLTNAIDKATEKVLGNEREGLEKAKEELAAVQKKLAENTKPQNKEGGTGQEKDKEKQQAGKGEGQDKDGKSQQHASKDQKGKEGQDGKGAEQKDKDGKKPGQQAGKGEGQAKDGKPQEQASKDQKGKEGQGKEGNKPGQQAGKDGKQSGQQMAQGEKGKEGNKPGQQAGKGEGQAKDGKPQQANGQPQEQQAENKSSQPQLSNSSSPSNQGGLGSDHDGPLTKQPKFKELVNNLRNVEDLLQNQKLRQKVASVRDRLRQMEMEKKRHSKAPTVSVINKSIIEPLAQLQEELNEELSKLNDTKGKIRLDKEPIPEEYEEQVRTYFDRLGKGEE